MRRYIVLLFISGIIWAQTDLDILDLKSGNKIYQKSTIETRAITDAKLKARKWLLFPSFVIVGTPLSFKLLEKTIGIKEASTLGENLLLAGGYLTASMTMSSVTTYSIYRRMDKIIYPKDLTSEDDKSIYKSIFDKKIRWEKIKNTVIGMFVLGSILYIEENYIDSDFLDVDHW
tara:strand:+ start:51 stop:572 length:522 start_codon:yes stop_codon:yes gene_type:complete